MYSFQNDYSEGACQRIMDELVRTNFEQTTGYLNDYHTKHAEYLIKERIKDIDANVHFLQGGTQTNLIMISAALRPHEAVIAVDTGHVCVHETGAIEATGHKVFVVPNADGKIKPEQIRKVCKIHNDEHMVKPKMVYISNSTEVGTIYKKAELEAISKTCRELGLYLYLDGARLACALTCKENDMDISDIAKLVDAFYIGGTKSGALLGEALVLLHPMLRIDFRFVLKQRGALTAKGRIIGIQFESLFEDNLFFDLAKHANETAQMISDALKACEFKLLCDSPTNQIFPIMTMENIEKLQEKYEFNIIEDLEDGTAVIRFVTSWATDKQKVLELIEDIKALKK